MIKTLLVFFGLICVSNSDLKASENELVWKNESMKLMKVTGTDREIGNHLVHLSGLRFRDSVGDPLLHFYQHLFDAIPFAPLKSLFLKQYSPIRLAEKFELASGRDHDLLKGMAEAYQVPFYDMLSTQIVPEAYLLMMKKLVTLKSKLGFMFGCSTVSAFGHLTKDGKRIIGRNLDYSIIGVLDREIGVTLVKPKGKFKYFSIGPQGALVVVSGMNEKGLVLATQTALSKETRLDGASLFPVNRKIMEEASSVDEAIRIVEKSRAYIAPWILFLSGRNPLNGAAEHAIVEVSGAGVSVFKNDEESLVVDNGYRTPFQMQHELYVSQAVDFHNHNRRQRMQELVDQKSKQNDLLDMGAMAEILSDSYSPYSHSSVEYSIHSIRVPEQVNSMVFYPDDLRVWVSQGPAPTSQSRYFLFDMEDTERGTGPIETFDPPSQPSAAFLSFVEATRLEKASKVDSSEFLFALGRAHAQSRDCSFSLLYGYHLMRNKKYDEGAQALMAARTCPLYSPQQKAVAHLYLGFFGLLKGDLERSRADFSQAQRQAFDRGLKKVVAKWSKKTRGISESKFLSLIKNYGVDLKLVDGVW